MPKINKNKFFVSNKTVRVFENLLMNAISYSLKSCIIKVMFIEEEKFVLAGGLE